MYNSNLTALLFCRGSNYAEFLIDGDESGQLKKSARALETRFPGALKICQGIASHHSKQLFEIYSNNEDPFWGKPRGKRICIKIVAKLASWDHVSFG